MRTKTRTTRRCALVVAFAALVGSPLVAAPTASAAPLDTLAAAVTATRLGSAAGIDVVETIRYGRATNLDKALGINGAGVVGAGSRVRVHVTAAPGNVLYYQSLRRQPSGSLLAAAGRADAAAGGQWATLSMMPSEWASSFARARGMSIRTAISSMDSGRMGIGDVASLDPIDAAVRTILPPYASAPEDAWTDVSTEPGAGGTTIIRGSARGDAEGEDFCRYRDIVVVVDPGGRVASSQWTATCPGRGDTQYASTASYGIAPIQPPTRPRVSMESALMRRANGAAADWSAVTRAAHRTMTSGRQQVRAVEEIRNDGGVPTAFVIDLDGASVDAATGQPAFSESVDGQGDGGWDAASGWWAHVPADGSEPDLAAALVAAGQAGAQFVVAANERFVRRYASLRWLGALDRRVDRIAYVRARALSDLDELVLNGQPGRVARASGAAGATLFTITPRGRGYLVDSGGGLRSLRAVVTTDAAGEVTEVTVSYDDGDYRNGRYVYDGRADLQRTSRIGVGVVSGAGAPAVPYAAIQPFLP